MSLYIGSLAKSLGATYTHTYAHFSLFFLQIWGASQWRLCKALLCKGFYKAPRALNTLHTHMHILVFPTDMWGTSLWRLCNASLYKGLHKAPIERRLWKTCIERGFMKHLYTRGFAKPPIERASLQGLCTHIHYTHSLLPTDMGGTSLWMLCKAPL